MSATFHTRAVFGPPRPVLVLSVKGEVDRFNQGELDRALSAVAGQRGSIDFRRLFGCQELSTTLVVDLREVTFLGMGALSGLVEWRDRHGHVPRLVVAANGIVRRSLAVSGQDNDFELFSDLADAVLSDAQSRDCD